MIWILFSVPVLVLLLYFTLPSKKRPDATDDRHANALAFYKAQLKEVVRDNSGEGADAETKSAARVELERRILRASSRASQTLITAPMPVLERVVMVGFIVAVGLYIYSGLGSPNLPASLGQRAQELDRQIEEGGPTFAEAIEVIEQRLEQVPDDRSGWIMLATTADATNNPGLAARSYMKLVAMEPENAEYRLRMLGSFLEQSRGQITPAVRLVVADFLAVAPDHPVARFYNARILAKDEKPDEARAILTELLNIAPPGAQWRMQVDAELAKLGNAQASIAPDMNTLDPETVDAVSQMDGASRQAMIKGMVDRLARRLASEPNDPQGWERLARARFVLEGPEAAAAILVEAMTENPASAARYQSLLDKLRQTGTLD